MRVDSTVADDSGEYYVVVTNTAGEAISEMIQVVIRKPITIEKQPQAVRVISGKNAEIRVDVSGTQPITYQWLFNNLNIAGANSHILNLDDVGGANEGT